MKKIWKKIKAFFTNLKKLYRLAQRVSFYDNTIRFDGSIESTLYLKGGLGVYMYTSSYDEECRAGIKEDEDKIIKEIEQAKLLEKNC